MQIPDHFSFVELDYMIVMPNHVHMVLNINDHFRGTACRAPTVERFALPVHGSVPTIIRSFKSAVTKQINKIRNTTGMPVWQRNYFERVIRNEKRRPSNEERLHFIIHLPPREWDKTF
jgi:REP element-mobilizing transposase RayT